MNGVSIAALRSDVPARAACLGVNLGVLHVVDGRMHLEMIQGSRSQSRGGRRAACCMLYACCVLCVPTTVV